MGLLQFSCDCDCSPANDSALWRLIFKCTLFSRGVFCFTDTGMKPMCSEVSLFGLSGNRSASEYMYIVAIFYPFSQFCEITMSLLSLQKQPNTAPNLFQRGVEYGKYVLSGGVFFHRHRYTQFPSQDSGQPLSTCEGSRLASLLSIVLEAPIPKRSFGDKTSLYVT